MMYAPMNSRQRPVSNPRGEAGAVTMSQRPVYQPQPVEQPRERMMPQQPVNRQTMPPPMNPQAAQRQPVNQQAAQQPVNPQAAPQQQRTMPRNPGNQGYMNQQQGNGMQQNRPMNQMGMRPGMGGGGLGSGILGKLLSIKDPIGSINKIATIIKLLG